MLSSNLLLAQDYVDLLKTHYAITPQNNFDSIGGSTDIKELKLDLTLPILLKNKNALITGLAIDQTTLKLNPNANSSNLTSISLKIGMQIKHSEKVSGTYLFLPKIGSDFKNINSRDYQFGGLALLKFKKSATFKYNAGVYYNKELFGPFVVPLLGFYYKSNNQKFEANLTLPIWADINYKLNKWMNVGMNFEAYARSYNLGLNNAYVVKKSNELFGYFQFKIKNSFIIQNKVGYSIGRAYNVYEYNDKNDLTVSAFKFGDDRKLLNTTFQNGMIFKVRLIYRFDLGKTIEN